MSVEPAPELVARISERGAALWERIRACTDRDVRVVCVTKAHPPEVAAAARAAGFVDLGENYAQELRDKAAALGPDAGIRWHFIGRLQSNKVRMIARTVALWETVDRRTLIDELARRAPGAAVLVQLDLAGLPGRGGCDPEEVPALVAAARAVGLQVEGLMGVGPPGPPVEARAGFRRLRELADDLGLRERSMGMSGDLEIALEEGSTMLRVGTALVGLRPGR